MMMQVGASSLLTTLGNSDPAPLILTSRWTSPHICMMSEQTRWLLWQMASFMLRVARTVTARLSAAWNH